MRKKPSILFLYILTLILWPSKSSPISHSSQSHLSLCSCLSYNFASGLSVYLWHCSSSKENSLPQPYFLPTVQSNHWRHCHSLDLARKAPMCMSCSIRQCVERTQRVKGEALTHKTNLMAVPFVFQKTKCAHCQRFLLTRGFSAFTSSAIVHPWDLW